MNRDVGSLEDSAGASRDGVGAEKLSRLFSP